MVWSGYGDDQLLDELTDLVVEIGEEHHGPLPVDHRLKRTERPAQKTMKCAAVILTGRTESTVPWLGWGDRFVRVIIIEESKEGAVSALVYPTQAPADGRRVDPNQMLVGMLISTEEVTVVSCLPIEVDSRMSRGRRVVLIVSEPPVQSNSQLR
jgi:hypothetical protein